MLNRISRMNVTNIKRVLWFLSVCTILSIYNISYAYYLKDLQAQLAGINVPVNGKVVSVRKGIIVINKGSKSGVKPGMQVNIYKNFGTYRLNGKTIILKKLVNYSVIKKKPMKIDRKPL